MNSEVLQMLFLFIIVGLFFGRTNLPFLQNTKHFQILLSIFLLILFSYYFFI